MMKVNPAHRITCSELFAHAWFLNKKLDEMHDKQKNVLELMTEMLQEQENRTRIYNNNINNINKNPMQPSSSAKDLQSQEVLYQKPLEKASSASTRSGLLNYKGSNAKLHRTADSKSSSTIEKVFNFFLLMKICNQVSY
jgi:hypothetical protein